MVMAILHPGLRPFLNLEVFLSKVFMSLLTQNSVSFPRFGRAKVKDEIFYAYDIVLDASKKRVIKAKFQTRPMS